MGDRKAYLAAISDLIREHEALLAEKLMVRSKAAGTLHRITFSIKELQINSEISTLRSDFLEKAINPLKTAISTGNVYGSQGMVQLDKIWALDKEHFEKCSNLNMKIDNAKENISVEGALLDEDVPHANALEMLSSEVRGELVQNWKNAETFLASMLPVFDEFQKEWNMMKEKFEDQVQNSLSQMAIPFEGDPGASASGQRPAGHD